MDIKELLDYQYLPDVERSAIVYLAQTITTYDYIWALYKAITYGIILGKRLDRQRRKNQYVG